MLPNEFEQKKLQNRSRLISLNNSGYLIDNPNNHNRKFIIERIFGLSENQTKIGSVDIKTLLIENSFYSTITSAYSDIIGENNLVDTKEIRNFVADYVATDIAGFTVVQSLDGNKKLRSVRAEHIFEIETNEWKNLAEIIIYKKENNKYGFVRVFKTGYNECFLYEISSQSLEESKPIPLSSIPETANISEKEITGLSKPAIFITDGFDIFPKIESLINAVDRSVNEIDTEIYKHHDAFLIIRNAQPPKGVIDPKTGIINKSKLGKIIMGADNVSVEFVANNNPMIDKAQENIEKHISRISAISNVPVEFFGIATKEWAIGAESRTLRMTLFFAKTQRIREIIDEAGSELLGQKIEWKNIVWLE